ncbi:hypothetical protein CFAM422_003201 [Trichoderma lentiforme]|uniref:Uncharacterized protein n=1 Tax=Trichoderma lentiforme TaxID=1567552 RepID=A0A9P4XIW3_9HYPO|nr:hypothetical protein CFAM422_003201 [Trichoderma lentiforme]
MVFLFTAVRIIVLVSQPIAFWFEQEPANRIYSNETGATPQNILLQEIAYVAGYLRFYGSQPGNPQFYTMPWPDADNCLVGNDTASVTFDDIENTVDGGAKSTLEQKAAALHSCDTNGSQVGVEVNTMDPATSRGSLRTGTYTNQGIHALNSVPVA